MRVILAGFILFSGILITAQSSKSVSAFDRQLIEQQKQLLRAIQDGDSSAVSRAVADDFRGIGTNGDFYDKGDVVESAHEGAPKDTRAYDFNVIRLDSAAAVVAYNLIVPGEHPRYRHMADVWVEIDGRWKLKFRQITPNLWSENDTD